MPDHTPKEKARSTSHGSHLSRGGTTAKQAGAIQAPRNSPAMSGFPKQGSKGVMRGVTGRGKVG